MMKKQVNHPKYVSQPKHVMYINLESMLASFPKQSRYVILNERSDTLWVGHWFNIKHSKQIERARTQAELILEKLREQ